MNLHTFSASWQPAHKLNFFCFAVGETSWVFSHSVCVCVCLYIPIAIYSRKGNRERKRGKIELQPFCLQPEILIYLLPGKRLNNFKVEQTATFSDIEAWGGKEKKCCWGTVLVLCRIQMNVEGTLLYKWRKQQTQAESQKQTRCKNHRGDKAAKDVHQLLWQMWNKRWQYGKYCNVLYLCAD